jgi:F0F1-type ATP synthase delta subunit
MKSRYSLTQIVKKSRSTCKYKIEKNCFKLHTHSRRKFSNTIYIEAEIEKNQSQEVAKDIERKNQCCKKRKKT